jgi:hypothetical protein
MLNYEMNKDDVEDFWRIRWGWNKSVMSLLVMDDDEVEEEEEELLNG